MSRLLSLPDPQALSIRAKALVFEDPASKALLAKVERIAASDATVLITGETGTGKELIARHVHTSSGRQGPFLAVNCGAFSDTMIEAELFGHEAGAYTGATQARSGWFEAAHQGTLFLDEVGDLPMSMQVKLLRVLQERQVVRIGSRKSIAVDVRLVAATNVDLARAVEAGHFRRDLFYRLNIASLHLPPLAQRPLDILALAHHFIAIYAQRLGLSNVRLSQAAQAQLLAHHWPGNIRELENVIHCALIVGKGAEIQADALSLRGAIPLGQALPDFSSRETAPVAPNGPVATVPDSPDGTQLLRQSLRLLFEQGPVELFSHVERELVTAAFEVCHFNQVHTSELLGISRNVLRTQLKRFGLLPERGARRLHARSNGQSDPFKAWSI